MGNVKSEVVVLLIWGKGVCFCTQQSCSNIERKEKKVHSEVRIKPDCGVCVCVCVCVCLCVCVCVCVCTFMLMHELLAISQEAMV